MVEVGQNYWTRAIAWVWPVSGIGIGTAAAAASWRELVDVEPAAIALAERTRKSVIAEQSGIGMAWVGRCAVSRYRV